MFLIHIDVSACFMIFSRYTPLKPLEIHAKRMDTNPIRENFFSWSMLFDGHCKENHTHLRGIADRKGQHKDTVKVIKSTISTMGPSPATNLNPPPPLPRDVVTHTCTSTTATIRRNREDHFKVVKVLFKMMRENMAVTIIFIW